jgi:hypothetical protein
MIEFGCDWLSHSNGVLLSLRRVDAKGTDVRGGWVTVTRLQQHWRGILATFFPTWEAERKWRCTTQTRRTNHGYCDMDRRIIEIGNVSADDDNLDALLIHEICHATASVGHAKKWQHRMSRAAAKARKVGRNTLANLLDEQVKGYQDSSFTMAHIYQEVEDALLANPSLTFAQIKRWLAMDYGLLVGEVEKSFRRIRRVYADARSNGLGARQHFRRLQKASL